MEQRLTKDRILGAVMGVFIGDALGVGPHWYYDLDKMREEYGDLITDYTAPKEGRFHQGLEAGDNSQTGQVAGMLLESLAERGEYDQHDFTVRLDGLLDTLDGTAQSGRYTDQAMRDVWQARKQESKPWTQAGSWANTAEAAVRMPILAARYADAFEPALEAMVANGPLTHKDPTVLGQSVAFGLIVLASMHGVPLDSTSTFITSRARKAGLELAVPTPVPDEEAPFMDAVLLPRWSVQASHNPAVRLQPPHAACTLFGLACALNFMLPAAYYFNARFGDDFEEAVLSSLNGGGNNMARTALTAALAGARQGLSGIPERFIKGLTDHEKLLYKAESIADAALEHQA